MTTSPDTHQPGYAANKARHLARLRRIEGQVRGLQRMIDDETYCIDVLTQVSAAVAALRGVALGLLEEHVQHCVVTAGSDPERAEAMVVEAIAAINRLVKS